MHPYGQLTVLVYRPTNRTLNTLPRRKDLLYPSLDRIQRRQGSGWTNGISHTSCRPTCTYSPRTPRLPHRLVQLQTNVEQFLAPQLHSCVGRANRVPSHEAVRRLLTSVRRDRVLLNLVVAAQLVVLHSRSLTTSRIDHQSRRKI